MSLGFFIYGVVCIIGFSFMCAWAGLLAVKGGGNEKEQHRKG